MFPDPTAELQMSRYTEVQGEMTERRVEVTMAYLAEGRLDIVSTEPGNNT